MNASGPTPHILQHNFTKEFVLITKLLPSIILVIIKIYTEVEVYDALVAVADRMPMRRASKTFHIPRSTLRSRLAGKQSHRDAADPQRTLSDNQEDRLADFLMNQASLGHALTRWETRALGARLASSSIIP